MKHFIQYIADQIPLQKFPHEMKKKLTTLFNFLTQIQKRLFPIQNKKIVV